MLLKREYRPVRRIRSVRQHLQILRLLSNSSSNFRCLASNFDSRRCSAWSAEEPGKNRDARGCTCTIGALSNTVRPVSIRGWARTWLVATVADISTAAARALNETIFVSPVWVDCGPEWDKTN